MKTKKNAASSKPTAGFTTEEKTAIKSRIQELRGKVGGDKAALDAIEKMPEPYRAMGKRIHDIIKTSAPLLEAKTWYGLPAYAKAGKVLCFMRMNPQSPFNDRYLTLGFNEIASLDEGRMWPTAFAIKELAATDALAIGALVKKAAG